MRQITLDANKPVKELGDLFGIFFEDINHAADGGLYAEMVQNRSFEFDPIDHPSYHAMTAWETITEGDAKADFTVSTEKPMNSSNEHYLVMNIHDTGKRAGVRNLGFNTGLAVKEGEAYRFSFFARIAEENKKESSSVTVSIEDAGGEILAKESIVLSSGEWRKYEKIMVPAKTSYSGRLVITPDQAGVYAIDMVSLFPVHTYKDQANGLRKDLSLYLEELKPKFMRFPGGCLVHDGSLCDTDRDSMYRWKKTIGNVEERPARRNNWRYNQTLGLGYYEYFRFCEDIHTKPLPVLPGGFNPHSGCGARMDEMQEWVQDALDLIEFANGDSSTTWGKIRADLGHEKPFHLEYIGIGNEEIGDGFYERYPLFHQAIREKYPDIKIINTSGPFVTGEGYEAGWASARQYGSDLVDEHYYQAPEWFLANMHHYDDYDPNGPKVFLGEYASWGNTFYHALVEAAYMTSLEKAPAVGLACYAPLFCNADYVNWQPDMIWFNNHQVYGTPNYYVQKLFMNHQGEEEIHMEVSGLDTPKLLSDGSGLSGQVSVSGNDVCGTIWDIKVMNHETGKETIVPSIEISEDNKENTLAFGLGTDYELTMKFRRSKGRKGLKIFFGRKDAKNTGVWEFGGWDNYDSLLTMITNGRGSCISHRIFHVEDKEYTLKLAVKGASITAYINGELFNEASYQEPVVEDIYLASSRESKTGDVILKAVNLTGEDKDVKLILSGALDKEYDASLYEMAGYAFDAVNSFEKPDAVIPAERTIKVREKDTITFKKHSLTVLRIHQVM
ncbi:MAG: alpha-L-arabinofuranosidase [Lachnospiraceae bacterium]|nr:alpha-L-arabinofuranosidase [Lachnospiraceae bacterium]